MDNGHTSLKNLQNSLTTSFVDASTVSEPNLRAQLLANGLQGAGSKVITVLEQELSRCEYFDFSVAFVTLGGITPLLLILKELESKGVPGRILTTDYLQFTEPEALEKLAGLKNIEVRLFRTGEAGPRTGFHTKGYIFDRDGLCSIIVGSSNLTQTALSTNQEWNARLISTPGGEFARQIRREFDLLWNSRAAHPLANVIDDYRGEYGQSKTVRERFFSAESTYADTAYQAIVPNAMQRQLAANVLSLMRCEPQGQNLNKPKKGLLISATGTGKTYASAFVIQALNPRRILFLVHREQIARKAMQSYRRILGDRYSYGLFIGQELDTTSDIVFATMQTMVRHLHDGSFARKQFEVVVIDEVHRAGAKSYEQIMAYFEPRLWFGMTATPDRPDGIDIYALFDHHILTEIRLQQALENDLLCPFHYFGITGLSVSDRDYEVKNLSRLASDERVEHILEQSRYFGASGSRIKGLVFCSSNEEAQILSSKFNARGLRTVSLSGTDSQAVRESACSRLAEDAGQDALDYIFSVDIFNEGIDIPEVNQVILLRPTQSPIIFVQQIGRGLRKHVGKEYVVILDFIGQCSNNFLIPVALSGDRTYSKDTMRRAAGNGTQVLSGPSSIHFDRVARERIYAAIDSARTNSMALLREAYRLLRFKLGRIPTISDFDSHGSVDPTKIFSVCGSYYAFLKRCVREAAYTRNLDSTAGKLLVYFSRRLGNAQRISEAMVLERILQGHRTKLKAQFVADFTAEFSFSPPPAHIKSCELLLTSSFWRKTDEKASNADCAVLAADGPDEWKASEAFLTVLTLNPDLKDEFADLIAFVRNRFNQVYRGGYRGTLLKLYERYTYEDVCRMLDWDRNMPAQNIGGYCYDRASKTLPVFVNYIKDEGAIAYEDYFVSENHIVALSKTNRSVHSPDADHIFKRKDADKANRIYLFVRKNKDDKEAKSFYFLGEIQAEGEPEPVKLAGGVDAFEINYRLTDAVRQDIYAYLTS